ncbi:hypothetical protein G6F46_015494 [Rhizopus delemar]|nr:hypothetical protein G6F46_015494 [Rhizopus delemar]
MSTSSSNYTRHRPLRWRVSLAIVRQMLDSTSVSTALPALAARLGELQAQATRLNALGERLTQMGKLEDGEFDFN